MSEQPIRIATRGSRLALWQARHVAELIRRAAPERTVEIVEVSTLGDRDKTEPLYSFAGFGVFTREVQRAILDGRADLAVHSLKDLPTESTEGLTLAAVPERGPMFDVLVLPASVFEKSGLDLIPPGGRVGTGSLRRQAQIRHQRDDVKLSEIRGNVETRLKKLDRLDYDALILAEAGLRRLGLERHITLQLRPPVMYPAVGQGALGIECRADDLELQAILKKIDHAPTRCCVTAERALLAALRAGCHAPLGALTTLTSAPHSTAAEATVSEQTAPHQLALEAVVLSPDGQQRLLVQVTGTADDPASIGREAAEELEAQGARQIVDDAQRNESYRK